MIKLAITGCQGRMGQRISYLARQDQAFQITTLLEHPDHPMVGQDCEGVAVAADLAALKASDVLIDFTAPEATMRNLAACRQAGVKLVIGTTGLSAEQVTRIKEASQDIAIVYSSNMSIGVNILFKLAQQLAAAAPENYSVKIVEAHHVHKKDAPSGTAKTLAQIIEQQSGRAVTDIESVREGEIIGDHDIIFESAEDTLIIRHHAKTRDIFAKGALVAARFLAGHQRGLFAMQDVLNIR